uniref:Uncharacterized protein n=1 Tax=viral metagenome TaxID=1070528 RepID=A0A6C0AM99_9ZZZZ
MSFQRHYDISCVTNELDRSLIQNAIDAVNLACSQEIDAWLYVETRGILSDYTRTIDSSDTMKNTIFNHMHKIGHSGPSVTYTIHSLVSLATEYSEWRRRIEEHTSREEGDNQLLNNWRQNVLVPYYISMSGGGCRSSVGPILQQFLELKASFQCRYLPIINNTEKELINLLGNTDNDRLSLLEDIIKDVCDSQELRLLANSIRRRIYHVKQGEEYYSGMLYSQKSILRGAIESKNPVALKAAMNPGWTSLSLLESNEYIEAQELLGRLSSSGDHVDENRS